MLQIHTIIHKRATLLKPIFFNNYIQTYYIYIYIHILNRFLIYILIRHNILYKIYDSQFADKPIQESQTNYCFTDAIQNVHTETKKEKIIKKKIIINLLLLKLNKRNRPSEHNTSS